MKSTGKNKRILTITGVFVAIGVIGFVVYSVINSTLPSGTINILYTPMSAEVTLNGEKATGENKVKPGKYKVSVAKEGFDSFGETLIVNEGETKGVLVALEPNAYYTQDWYEKNPEDAMLRERIFFRSYEELGEAIEKKSPIIDILPYVPPERTYRIDYGKAKDSGAQAVYISYYTDIGKKKAEDYIISQGYKLEDYEVIYRQKKQGQWWP